MRFRSNDPSSVYLLMNVGVSFLFTVVSVTNLVYQVEVAHLVPLQLLLVGSVLELTCLMFQLPTGLLADAYSRRWAVASGYGLVGAGFILEGLMPRFTAIALSQVIWGIGITLASGADDAWIADELGDEHAGPLFLRASQYGQVAGLLGIVAGVGLASVRLSLPIVVGGLLFLPLSAYLGLAMTEEGFQAVPRHQAGAARLVAGLRSSISAISGRPLVQTILCITVLWGLSGEGVDRLYQVHLIKDIGLPSIGALSPVLWFGLISGGSTMIGVAATHIVRSRLDLENHAVVTRSLFAFSAARAVMIAGFALATNLGAAVTFIWAASVMRQVFGPVQRAWLNRSLDPTNRATLFSVDGQADALGQIVGGPILGVVASGVSIRAALVVSAALLGSAFPLFGRALGQADPDSRELPTT